MKNEVPKNKQPRKETGGAIRNKERTQQKLINAVGAVLKEKGYAGLSIPNIIKKAKVDRRLIYTYYGGLDNLIEEYLNSRDYWMTKVAPKVQEIAFKSDHFGEKQIVEILHTLYDAVDISPELQKMILWQISEYHDKLRALVDNREKLGEPLFQATDPDFKGTDINLRAILAIQIAGIYYLNLHAKSNKSTFCEIELNSDEGKNAIKEALEMVVGLVYEKKEEREIIK